MKRNVLKLSKFFWILCFHLDRFRKIPEKFLWVVYICKKTICKIYLNIVSTRISVYEFKVFSPKLTCSSLIGFLIISSWPCLIEIINNYTFPPYMDKQEGGETRYFNNAVLHLHLLAFLKLQLSCRYITIDSSSLKSGQISSLFTV